MNSECQRQLCQHLGLQYRRPNHFGSGGPHCVLTQPNFKTVRRILGDGNCLFRALSYVVTGSEDDHMAVRRAIVNHMVSIAHLLLGSHVQQNSIQAYIQDTAMNQEGTWGTNISRSLPLPISVRQTCMCTIHTMLIGWCFLHVCHCLRLMYALNLCIYYTP